MAPPIAVHINYYGVLREITGKESDEIVLESASLEDLLKTLLKNYESSFGGLFHIVENFGSHLNIFLNHMVVPSTKIPKVTLEQGDQIDLFVPASGG
jgi:MoaD family protein